MSQPETTEATVGVPYEMPIEQGAIQLFAAAMQSDNPEYQGRDAVVPPAFLITCSRWAPEGGAIAHGIPRDRLLHGEQEFTFHGQPPRVGDTLHVQERIAERFEKSGKRGGSMKFLVIATDFTDANGKPVAEMRKTLIERGE